jgi:hypothetical protein
MRQNFILFGLSSIIFFLSSCNNCCQMSPEVSGNWVSIQKQIITPSLAGAASFVIDSNAYILLGIDSAGNYSSENFSFNTITSLWVQYASFPGSKRKSAVSFTVGNNGYIGGGFDGTKALSDYWQYNPVINSWSKIADLPASPRYDAVAFGIGNYGYLGTGTDGTYHFNDFWRYNPNSNSWQVLSNFPGPHKSGAVSFVYKNIGYVVTGITAAGTLDNSFYSFDPSKSDSTAWQPLRPISNYSPLSYDDGYTTLVRTNAVGFVMLNTTSDGGGDRAYITTGTGSGGLNNTTWAYNFSDSLWNQKTSYERPGRIGAIGFSALNKAFVGLGTNGATNYSNLDEWFPDMPYNQKD